MGVAPGQLFPHLHLKHLPAPAVAACSARCFPTAARPRSPRASLPAAPAGASERLQKYQSQNKTDGLNRPFCFAAVRAGHRYKQRRSFRFRAVRKAIEGRKRSAAAVHPDVFRVPSRSAFRTVSKKTTCRLTASPQRCRHFRNLQRFRKRKCAKKCRPF